MLASAGPPLRGIPRIQGSPDLQAVIRPSENNASAPRGRFEASLGTLAGGELFEGPQSHFQVPRLQNTTTTLDQCGNSLCVAGAELSGGDFPQDVFRSFGKLFCATDLQRSGL